MLRLIGHPFSSYTWKCLIPFYASDLAFQFVSLEEASPADGALVQSAGPAGKFPVLVDGERILFESTTIIEHLALHHLPDAGLLPADPDAAIEMRKMDRVFDNYVMNAMQVAVDMAIRNPGDPDPSILSEVHARLERTYRWLEGWLVDYDAGDRITLIECAAAPALFYADWVWRIPGDCPRLRNWRAHLLALPAVARCVDDARPWRPNFPLGAPDRD